MIDMHGYRVELLSAPVENVPTLQSICQQRIFDLLEVQHFSTRAINELCKTIPDFLLEPIFKAMFDRGIITDVALAFYLVPDRISLKINQAVNIRKSVFKMIGLNCPNLVCITFYVVSLMCLMQL